MEKLAIRFLAISKDSSETYSNSFEVGSKDDLAKAVEEFDKEVEFRYYIESTLTTASRPATDEELAWLNENEDIGFDGVNN